MKNRIPADEWNGGGVGTIVWWFLQDCISFVKIIIIFPIHGIVADVLTNAV